MVLPQSHIKGPGLIVRCIKNYYELLLVQFILRKEKFGPSILESSLNLIHWEYFEIFSHNFVGVKNPVIFFPIAGERAFIEVLESH